MDTSPCLYFQVSIRSPKKISNNAVPTHCAASPADATVDDVQCMGTVGLGDGNSANECSIEFLTSLGRVGQVLRGSSTRFPATTPG